MDIKKKHNLIFEEFTLVNINNDFVREKFEEKLNKAIEEKDITTIADFIIKGYLFLTRELLKFKGNGDWSVAHRLAFESDKTNILKDYYEDRGILMLKDSFGDSVAHWLARNSDKNGWITNDYDILILRNEEGETVAHILAELSYKNKWTTKDERILSLKNPSEDRITVAHKLALNSRDTFWYINNLDILKMQTKKEKDTVAHYLAKKHPYWVPSDKTILDLKNARGETVEDILKFRKKINEKKKIKKENGYK